MRSFKIIWWFIYLIILLCTLRGSCMSEFSDDIDNVIVDTSSGQFIGKTVPGCLYKGEIFVKEFLGVPFAKPPIDNLRFRRPVKVEAWNSSRECFCMPKACVQSTSNPWPWPWQFNYTNMGEDCLYMNIWIPNDASSDKKKSVLFFIYGGGIRNSSGSASDPVYDGRMLSAFGNIIVVVPNYRIGTLGFWSTRFPSYYPDLSQHGRAPGNVGIWDVIMALQWVYDNIENFGGDKDKITVAGQGFGAVIASLLPITHEAKGLFRRLILQSGSAMWQHNKNVSHNLDISMDIVEMMHCAGKEIDLNKDEDEIIDCMLTKDAFELAEAEVKTEGFYPVWGDGLFENNPREEILKNNFSFSELLIGYSGNEGIPLFLDLHPEEEVFQTKQVSKCKRSVAQSLQFQNLSETYTPSLHKRNPQKKNNWRLKESVAEGDYTIICPAIYYAERSVQSGAEVYFYIFEHRPIKRVYADWIGAAHFDEVKFIFGVPYRYNYNYRWYEQWLSTLMMDWWSQFVKYGKPIFYWPLFDPNYDTMRFPDQDYPIEESRKDIKERCDYFRYE